MEIQILDIDINKLFLTFLDVIWHNPYLLAIHSNLYLFQNNCVGMRVGECTEETGRYINEIR